jgi:hypothetical protein
MATPVEARAIEDRHDLLAEVADMQASFDLRWAADMRAIKRWQTQTGRDLTWPDHADLVVWLLAEVDRLENILHNDWTALTERERILAGVGRLRRYEALSPMVYAETPRGSAVALHEVVAVIEGDVPHG